MRKGFKMPRSSALRKLEENGSYSKTAAEVLDFSYYDTMIMATGTLLQRLFITPLGQGGKSLADTNMVSAGQLPQGQNFKIYNFKVFYQSYGGEFASADVNLWYKMLTETTFEFIVPGKDNLGQWTLWEMIGESTMIALIPTTAGDNIPINQPRYGGVFPLNKPIKIGAVQSFEVRIQHHVAPSANLDADKLFISLNGRLVRMS